MVSSGEYVVCLRDPEGLVAKMLLVSPEAAWALSLFDGHNTLSQISARFAARFGYAVPVSELAQLVAELDELYLLWNERYLERRAQVVADFLASPVRPPFHAGLSYPADPAELAEVMEECVSVAPAGSVSGGKGPLLGLVAPHIDFPRGKAAYGALLREIAAASEAETFVILGTAHYTTTDTPYIMTRKRFRTPFGTLECDVGFLDELASALSWDPFEGEEAHRTEHSIELQTVLMGRARGGLATRIVPVLCNGFSHHVRASRWPETDERVEEFISSLRRLLHERGQRAVVVASGDLAHVGLKFGDPTAADDNRCRWVRERDLATIEAMEAVEAASFYEVVLAENDARRICGLSPIYTLLSTTPAGRGRTLNYSQAMESDTGSMVSFAAVAFHG